MTTNNPIRPQIMAALTANKPKKPISKRLHALIIVLTPFAAVVAIFAIPLGVSYVLLRAWFHDEQA